MLENILSYLDSPRFFQFVERVFGFIGMVVVYAIVVRVMLKIFILINQAEPDYDMLISIGERGTLIIATIAILTFTYALTLDYPDKKDIQKSGKYFFKSALDFIIGMVFIIGFRDTAASPSNLIPDIGYSFLPVLLKMCE